jgi:hypothetical protein
MGIAVGQVLEYYRLYDRRRVNDTQGIQIALLNLARSDKSPRRPYNHRWWTNMRIMKRNLVQWMANGNVPPDDSQQDGGRGALMPWVPEVDVLYALRFLDLRTSGIPRSLRDILNEVNLLFLIDPEQPVPEFWRSARLNDPVWRRRHMQQESKSSVTCSISDAELDEIIKDIQAILGAEGSSSSTVVWQPPQWNRERDLPRDAWRIIQSASQTQPSASFPGEVPTTTTWRVASSKRAAWRRGAGSGEVAAPTWSFRFPDGAARTRRGRPEQLTSPARWATSFPSAIQAWDAGRDTGIPRVGSSTFVAQCSRVHHEQRGAAQREPPEFSAPVSAPETTG